MKHLVPVQAWLPQEIAEQVKSHCQNHCQPVSEFIRTLVLEACATGLATNRIEPAANDNMQTYMTLMAARSQDLVVQTMARVLAGDAKPLPKSKLASAQYYAPTLGQYLGNGLKRGVW